jgi:hypothetical protein
MSFIDDKYVVVCLLADALCLEESPLATPLVVVLEESFLFFFLVVKELASVFVLL